jgi:cobalt transporter subunit CbtA
MIFSRIIFNGMLVGIVSGLILSVIQTYELTNIIYEAESYEVVENHDHSTHSHDEESWAPEDGIERIAYTFLSNILAAMGLSIVMLSLMSLLQQQRITTLSFSKGFAWGLAGFLAFFIAPGIGLPPEIPGVQAALVEHRQAWWLLTVVCASFGIGVLAFASFKYKILGVLTLLLPYVIRAPHISGPEFSHPDPAAVEQLIHLHERFIIISGVCNFIFWIVLGVMCAVVLNHWVITVEDNNA